MPARRPGPGRDLATVCPAAAAQYDAAGTNEVPSSQIGAGSGQDADFLLDCGHIVTKKGKDHFQNHRRGRPGATTCGACSAAGADLATAKVAVEQMG